MHTDVLDSNRLGNCNDHAQVDYDIKPMEKRYAQLSIQPLSEVASPRYHSRAARYINRDGKFKGEVHGVHNMFQKVDLQLRGHT